MLSHRFDSELSQAHEETQREKLQREKLQREKDMLLAEAFSLKQQLEVPRLTCFLLHLPQDLGAAQCQPHLPSFSLGKRLGHCRVHPEGCLLGG